MTDRPDAPDALPNSAKARAIVLCTESALAARAPSPALARQPKPLGEGLVAWSGERAAIRTIKFLTAGIHNAHTRRAYTRAAKRFLGWCNARGMTLADVRSPDVAAYIHELGLELSQIVVSSIEADDAKVFLRNGTQEPGGSSAAIRVRYG
jgi:hypothetical protein